MAKPDLLGHFSQLFWGKHDCLSTLPHPQPPTNALQCTAMHPNSPKYTDLCHWCFWCILVNLDALQCIVVHWWGVEAEVVYWYSHAFLRTVEKGAKQIRFGHSSSTKFFFEVTWNRQNSRPGETYPYDQLVMDMVNMGVHLKHSKKNWPLEKNITHLVYWLSFYGRLKILQFFAVLIWPFSMQILKMAARQGNPSEYSNFSSKVLKTFTHSICQLPSLQLLMLAYMEQPTALTPWCKNQRNLNRSSTHDFNQIIVGSQWPWWRGCAWWWWTKTLNLNS